LQAALVTPASRSPRDSTGFPIALQIKKVAELNQILHTNP
jgi:hypothetical protein